MKHVMDEELLARARALGPVIREHAAEAEHERRLSKAVVTELTRARLTKMFLPRSLGGLETDPVTALGVVEAVARFDAVAGWFLMVANSAAWYSARLTAEA